MAWAQSLLPLWNSQCHSRPACLGSRHALLSPGSHRQDAPYHGALPLVLYMQPAVPGFFCPVSGAPMSEKGSLHFCCTHSTCCCNAQRYARRGRTISSLKHCAVPVPSPIPHSSFNVCFSSAGPVLLSLFSADMDGLSLPLRSLHISLCLPVAAHSAQHIVSGRRW